MKDYATVTTTTNHKSETPDNFDYMMTAVSLVLFVCATSFMWFNV